MRFPGSHPWAGTGNGGADMTVPFNVLADPTALDLLLSLERRGVLISLADDQTLRVRGALQADDVQALRDHKAGVLRLVHYVEQLPVM